MDKNPPANAGDTGSIPGLGRFHMPWSSWAHAPRLLLSLCSRAHKTQLPSPHAAATESCAPRPCALKQQKPLQWEAHAQLQRSLHSQQLEKAQAKQQRPKAAINMPVSSPSRIQGVPSVTRQGVQLSLAESGRVWQCFIFYHSFYTLS